MIVTLKYRQAERQGQKASTFPRELRPPGVSTPDHVRQLPQDGISNGITIKNAVKGAKFATMRDFSIWRIKRQSADFICNMNNIFRFDI